ncbi:hypothetical protein ACWDKQ_19615 [Saccharopolyspora sp. NPDC000995]
MFHTNGMLPWAVTAAGAVHHRAHDGRASGEVLHNTDRRGKPPSHPLQREQMAKPLQRSAMTGREAVRDDPVRRWIFIATGAVLGIVVGELRR